MVPYTDETERNWVMANSEKLTVDLRMLGVKEGDMIVLQASMESQNVLEMCIRDSLNIVLFLIFDGGQIPYNGIQIIPHDIFSHKFSLPILLLFYWYGSVSYTHLKSLRDNSNSGSINNLRIAERTGEHDQHRI